MSQSPPASGWRLFGYASVLVLVQSGLLLLPIKLSFAGAPMPILALLVILWRVSTEDPKPSTVWELGKRSGWILGVGALVGLMARQQLYRLSMETPEIQIGYILAVFCPLVQIWLNKENQMYEEEKRTGRPWI